MQKKKKKGSNNEKQINEYHFDLCFYLFFFLHDKCKNAVKDSCVVYQSHQQYFIKL